MSHEKFNVLYDGEALRNNEMNVQTLAPALYAFGTLLEEANAAINGSRAKVSVNVKASFKTGCFGIELNTFVSLVDLSKSLFTSENIATAKNLLEWLGLVWGTAGITKYTGKGLIGLIKWLRSRKISKIETVGDETFKVYVGDEYYETEKQVLWLYQNHKIHEAFKDVLSPLEQEGIDEFAVTDLEQTSRFMVIKESEVPFFEPPKEEDEILADDEVKMNLQVVSLSFEGNYKWRFSDGNSIFNADVEDEGFLRLVQSGEVAFAKGDIIKARLHKLQYIKGENMKTEYRILEVLEHRHGAPQMKLPFVDN
ncbi:hypothetical protein QP451_01665 [Neisseria subflava]|uniref:Uncharacterized protein n=2 Tax=Neisseria subflava TaxID=28449 RepID=A0AAW6Y0S4_NEISU|nr:hypothetical protein [Neisseria subflava]